MFYYPHVLHRHTGCFATIWLAATKGVKISRRELLKVNVGTMCDDIIDYVMVKVPPPQPHLPQPRFSLYLSSQLQYGVVLVYHRQCAFLLEEVHQAIELLLRSERHQQRIDIMAEPNRLALDMPDCLYQMEEAEGAQDPFFGLMDVNKLPSPYSIPQQLQLVEEVTPQRSLATSPRTTPGVKDFRSPLAAITMKEKEQLVINTAEFEGAELPEATDKEIDMLMDQRDQFHYRSTDVEEREGERAPERSRELEGAITSIHQLRETLLAPDVDSLWLLDEETGRPAEVPVATVAMETTAIPMVAMPPLAPGSSGKHRELEKETEGSWGQVDVPGRRRGCGGVRGHRRRQLVFADLQIQISGNSLKEQIENLLIETRSLSEMLSDLPSLAKMKTPAQLFSAPAGSLLHPDLLSQWKQCAHLTTLPRSGDKRRREEEEEEEIPRDLVEGLQPPEASSASSMILDMSKEDKSLSDLITPVNRWSPQQDIQVYMEPIVEEQVNMPETETDTNWDITAQSLLGMVSSCLQRSGRVTFDTLLPPEADRSTAAHAFFKLLELVSARELGVCQTEPYSLITITMTT